VGAADLLELIKVLVGTGESTGPSIIFWSHNAEEGTKFIPREYSFVPDKTSKIIQKSQMQEVNE
jgi:hypothetical protein